jgi:deoxyribodipyrimidine photo-lyase
MWFRRDLRVEDNAALYHALKSCRRVFCFFVFDRDILDGLPRADRRVEFIRESLVDLERQISSMAIDATGGGVALSVLHGRAVEAVATFARERGADAVFANHDDEPDALSRDGGVQALLKSEQISLHTFKDHVIFERSEVLTLAGKPYSVFTPYKNAWLKKVDSFYLKAYPTVQYANSIAVLPGKATPAVPTLEQLGFLPTNLHALAIAPGSTGGRDMLQDFIHRMDRYADARNFPAVRGPSYLGVHLRFGTLSIRKLARLALERLQEGSEGASVWLSELIWRDFYAQILANFPFVSDAAFKPEYDRIIWDQGTDADALFSAWCDGRTGYPLIDAAMAQINQTGYMHNRLRMVTASFLTKDLGLDWRRGERYFAEKLNDYDLASNNGGWQWAASSGCDAQPYFRVFNPVSQSEKFDSGGNFIRKYLPVLEKLAPPGIHSPWTVPAAELAEAGVVLGENYPRPVVRHDEARALTLQRYSVVKKT